MQRDGPRNVVMVVRGTGGDLLPFLQMARHLKERGHNVTLVSHGIYAERVTTLGLDFAPLDDQDETSRLQQIIPTLHRPQEMINFSLHLLEEKLALETALLRRLVEARPGGVLVTHHNSFNSCKMAVEETRTPLVCVFMAPAFLLSLPVMERAFRANADRVNRARAGIGLPAVNDWRAWMSGADEKIAFWPDWFMERDEGLQDGVTQAGFLPNNAEEAGELPAEAARIMDGSGRRVVLITHATSQANGADFFHAASAACAEIGWPALAVTPHVDQLPSRREKGVTWFPYLPFSQVMPRVGVVVHHGGIGTAVEALLAATPQLLLPVGFDRPDNAERLQHLGIAESLPPPLWDSASIGGAIRRLAESAEVRRRCHEVAQTMKQATSALHIACDIIERATFRRAWRDNLPVISAHNSEETIAGMKLEQRVHSLSGAQRALLLRRLRARPSDSVEEQR